MARHERPPEGFAIAELPDGRYYPLDAERLYSASYPDGMLVLYSYVVFEQDSPRSFAHYAEALTFCREQAELKAWVEQGHFENLAVESECYPERCAWYSDLIAEVTGKAPEIICGYRRVTVMTPGYRCWMCSAYYSPVSIVALTIEEALSEAAETVYAHYTRCCARSAAAQGTCLEGERHAS